MTIAITNDNAEVAAGWDGYGPGPSPTAQVISGTVAMDNSYPTGGESFTAAMIGLSSIDCIIFGGQGGYRFEYDYTNAKLIALYGDNNNAADGPLIQPPNTTDLSALTAVHFRAVGRITVDHELP